MTRQCERCEREIIPRRRWRQMTRDERKAANDAGRRETRAAGLCVGCHELLRRRGELGDRIRANASIDPTRHCARCGISGVLAELTICTDCADVTTDLDEVGRWIREPIPA